MKKVYFVMYPDGSWSGLFRRKDVADQVAREKHGQVVVGREFTEAEIDAR